MHAEGGGHSLHTLTHHTETSTTHIMASNWQKNPFTISFGT